jgi:hypothetical protein
MPHKRNVPRRSEGGAARDQQQRAAAVAAAAAPASAPAPHHDARPSVVSRAETVGGVGKGQAPSAKRPVLRWPARVQGASGGVVAGMKVKLEEEERRVPLPASLLQLAALAPPPPQHVDVKWVEGQGDRCIRTNGKPGGTGWRCSSAAIPGCTLCVHHAAQDKARRGTLNR